MAKYISQHVALLIIAKFMVKHNIPEDVIKRLLITFNTTTYNRLWAPEHIELVKKKILEKYE